jgi:Cellulase (glycosyl hydrolase family 5)
VGHRTGEDRWLRRLIAGAGGAAALAALAILPASALAGPATGVNVPITAAGNASLVAPLHGQYVRVFVRWDQIETAKGTYSLDFTDQELRGYPAGTKIVVDLLDTPGWANGGRGLTVPPTNPQDFADFLHFLAARYRGQVAGWEIWNEEDVSSWFAGSAADYTAMLKAAYPAAKSADPGTTVLIGGLTGNDYHFVEQIYANGGQGSFDAVAVHTDTACNLVSPYSYFRDPDGRIDQFSFLGYREVHSVMAAHGDASKPIWMTEFGWSTTTSICNMGKWAGQKSGGVSASDQALFLRQALHCAAQDPYVPVMIWYALNDGGTSDTSLNRYGLVSGDGTLKPAYAALENFDALGDTLSGPCGNFSGPQLTLLAPKPNLRFNGPLLIKVAANSTYGVPRITIFYDGKRIRNFTSKAKPAQLSGQINWMGAKHLKPGRHTISAVALDPMGNQTSTSVVVYRVASSSRHHRRHKHR